MAPGVKAPSRIPISHSEEGGGNEIRSQSRIQKPYVSKLPSGYVNVDGRRYLINFFTTNRSGSNPRLHFVTDIPLNSVGVPDGMDLFTD